MNEDSNLKVTCMKTEMLSSVLRHILLMLLCLTAPTLTAEILADGFDTSTLDYANWQSQLPDEAFVSDISLPGAHDAATGEGFSSSIEALSAQTQSLTMAQMREQWGVRGFDLRICLEKGQLYCCHGMALINKTVKDAMLDACRFLHSHPGEFFLYHILVQEYSASQKDEFERLWDEILATQVDDTGKTVKDFVRDYWSGTRVKDIRGKMMFFKRWVSDGPDLHCATLWDWSERNGDTFAVAKVEWYENEPVLVQDYANPKNNNEIQTKVSVLTKLLDQTVNGNHRWAGKGYKRWAMNFCSGYSGSLSSKSAYGEVASNTNKAVYEYLQTHSGPAGILFADWIGVDKNDGITKNSVYGKRFVTSIILNNYRYIYDYVSPVRMECRDIRKLGVDRFRNGNMTWADVDNDGRLELLLLGHDDANGWSTSYSMIKKDGSNTVARSMTLPEAEGDGARQWSRRMLVAGDFNADGNVDVLHGGSWESKLMTGDGNGGFSVWTDRDGNSQFLHYNELCNDDQAGTSEKRMQGMMFMIDMNMDGWPDILTYNRGSLDGNKNLDESVPVIIRRGASDMMDSSLPEINDLPALKGGTMAVGDYDHDGWPDVLVTGRNAEGKLQMSIALNRGGYRFDVITPESLQPYATYYGAVLMADFNNDGELDVFVTGKGADDKSVAAVLINKGNDTFEPAEIAGTAPGVHVSGCDWTDLDGDGNIDIVYAGNNDDAYRGNWGSAVLLYNNGDNTFTAVREAMQGVRAGATVRAFDDDNDGWASVAVMGYADTNTGVSVSVDKDYTASFRIYDVMPSGNNSEAPRSALRLTESTAPVSAVLTKTSDNKTKISWEPVGDYSRYNWIVTLRDGRRISAVPVNAATGQLLVANTEGAATGSSVVLDINPDDVASYGVHAVSGADKSASPLVLRTPGTLTGIGEVEADDAGVCAEYFDITGRPVTNPAPGSVVIERRGSSVRKVRF